MSESLHAKFDDLVADVWRDLQKIFSDEVKAHVGKVQFHILDGPTADIIADLPEELAAEPELIDGLHLGTPITEDLVTHPAWEPVRIYLFRNSLCNRIEADDPDPVVTLREEIAITLLHEIGHFFGLSEEDLERLGYD